MDLYKIVRYLPCQTQASPVPVLAPMVRPNATGHAVPVPVQPVPQEVLMEYLSTLFQNGSLPPLPTTQPPSLPVTSPTPAPPSIPPPAQGCSFTRAGRGTGGVLVEKQKVSKQITASTNKRKTLVDPDIETQPAVAESANARQAKRPKTAKVSRSC